MRIFILFAMALLVGAGALMACNSYDRAGVLSAPQNQQSQQQPQQPAQGGTNEARRISASELHDMWERGGVLIVDTRDEAAYKTSHIKGAISIPSNQVLARIDEFPRDKMIVTYCT